MNTLVNDDVDLSDTPKPNMKNSVRFRICIFGLAIAVVWIIATIIFLYSGIRGQGEYFWMAFIWALPASCGALLITSFGMNLRVFRFVVNSVAIWTLLTAVFLHFILQNYILWPVFLVGIPLQLIAVFSFIIRKK